jgi:hypothetical protein
MSSKKQIRRQQRERSEEVKKRSRLNPATLFIFGVVAAVLVMGVFAFFFQSDANRPPWPGAVWSPQHNHWH